MDPRTTLWVPEQTSNVNVVVKRHSRLVGGSGGVMVIVSDLESKGPGFDPRAVPKSECMFVNIYHYEVVSYVILSV